MLDIDEENGKDLVNNINNLKGSAVFYKADVSDYYQVKNVFDQIADKHGSISILINNAGVCNNYPLQEINPKSINKTIATNLLAHFWTVKLALPKMIQSKKGHIVAIASNFGLLGRSSFTRLHIFKIRHRWLYGIARR